MLSLKLTQGRLPENEQEIIVQGGLEQNGKEISHRGILFLFR